MLLYDTHRSKNADISHWKYEQFCLDDLNDDECRVDFRFLKNDLYHLAENLDIPDEISCYNNVKVSGIEALCILLKRFAYPCRYVDMVLLFARPVPQLSIVANHLTDFLYQRWSHLLTSFNQPWLSSNNLQIYADAIQAKGGALQNCWGFIDGTVRPVARPGNNQRILYNGHKKCHAIKFQSVVSPNGLIANLYGPVEVKRHDSGMLAKSGLLPQLQRYSFGNGGNILCLYGDPAYPLRPQLQCPFKGAVLTQGSVF